MFDICNMLCLSLPSPRRVIFSSLFVECKPLETGEKAGIVDLS